MISVCIILFSSGIHIENSMTDNEILQATRHLEGFSKVNDEPQFMAPPVAQACAQASGPGMGAGSDPHIGKYINVFVNAKGIQEMTQKKKPAFPAGTMILKEKMGSFRDSSNVAPAELFTIMIKREKGYNPSCGDWEFATVDVKSAEVKRGKITSCMGCHVNYTRSDFISSRKYLDKKYAAGLK